MREEVLMNTLDLITRLGGVKSRYKIGLFGKRSELNFVGQMDSFVRNTGGKVIASFRLETFISITVLIIKPQSLLE